MSAVSIASKFVAQINPHNETVTNDIAGEIVFPAADDVVQQLLLQVDE